MYNMDQSSAHETIYDSNSFLEVKNSLLSKKEWTSLDFGIVDKDLVNIAVNKKLTDKEKEEDIMYLLLIDNRCYVIGNDLSIYFFDLNYIFINKLEEP